MIRRVRAAVILGLTWAVPRALAGIAFITWRVFLGSPRLAFPWSYWPRMATTSALTLGVFGFVAGVVFALTVRKTVGARTLDDLSPGYAARWGATAGAASIAAVALTGIVAWPLLVVGGALFAIVGAGSAMATLAMAQRADAPMKSLTR